MRIELVARAALTILVVVGVGAAGCSEDEPAKGPVITTAPSVTAPPKPSSPQAPDDDFEKVAASGYIDTESRFKLSGYIRNTGNATGTFAVICRGEDQGIAIFSATEAVLDVPELTPGVATKFKIKVDGGEHKSIRWTYWATKNGASPGTKYSLSFAFP